MLRKIVTVFILITWPISLFLYNTQKDFLHYLLPLDPKFAVLPLLFVLIYFRFKKPLLIVFAIIVLILPFKSFLGQTIFIHDYEASQQVLQKEKLYPSIFLARLFQNKARIPLEKLSSNFFALTDPNNYFFGFAPRQITVDNQNLKKFPFLSMPLLLIGLYYLTKDKNWKLILGILIAAIINLSFLTNFDRNDFILWLPISLLIIHGLNIFDKQFKYAKYFYIVFIIFSSIEILRIFLMK